MQRVTKYFLMYVTDQVYDRLEEYMREEGPVLPLLLTGHPGLGKSTLLAKWYVGSLNVTNTCGGCMCM